MLRFTWRIENFSNVKTKQIQSEAFSIGGCKWKIAFYPMGNGSSFLSLYLDVAEPKSLPYGWSRYAEFSLVLISQTDDKYSVRKDFQQQFNAQIVAMGSLHFLPLDKLHDPERGYLVDDTCIIEAKFPVHNITSTQSTKNNEVEKGEPTLEAFFSSLSQKFAKSAISEDSKTMEKSSPRPDEINKAKEELQSLFGISFTDLTHPNKTLLLEKSLSTLITAEVLEPALQTTLQSFKKDLPGLSVDYVMSSLSKAEIEEKLAQVGSLSTKMAESVDCFQKLQSFEVAAVEEKRKLEEEIGRLKTCVEQIDEKIGGHKNTMKILYQKSKNIKDEYEKLEAKVPGLTASKQKIENELARIEKAWEVFKSQVEAFFPYISLANPEKPLFTFL